MKYSKPLLECVQQVCEELSNDPEWMKTFGLWSHRYGPLTSTISGIMKWDAGKTRRGLNRLNSLGKIFKDQSYPGAASRWWADK